MKATITGSLLAAVLVAGNAVASEDLCKVPKDEWQPESALRAKLESEGWTIKRVKIDDGCYEVYGTTSEGKKMETYFDPKSFAVVKSEED